MNTRETIQGYFNALEASRGWESFLSQDITFTSFTSPLKQIRGKDAYLAATKRFYSGIVSVKVNHMLIEGDRACALTHYELRSPGGDPFTSDVAEIFTVADGGIESFSIYFDSAPFPK
jgi:ketosteroid isomerase-like protein